MAILSGLVLYKGTSIASASLALEPGTCYGKGFDYKTAMASCVSWRKLFLKEQTNGNFTGRDD